MGETKLFCLFVSSINECSQTAHAQTHWY